MSIGAKPWEGAGGAATVPDASETTKGKIRIATSAEAATGTDDLTAMTPLTVKERIDAAITGGIEYKGTFDASTGLPSLANAEQGDLYKVSTAGIIYGKSWAVGDHLLINADMGGTVTPSKIDKVDNTESVTSVNGQTGPVSLGIGDLNNVTISGGGAGGDLVEYDAVDGRWENVTKASINVGDFNDDSTYQLRDAGLTSIAGLTTSADKMIYATASDTYTVTDLTAAGRALLDDADATAQRTTLGLGTAATSDTGDFLASTAALNDLSDVTISSVSNGQVISYNSTSGEWENSTPASGGATDLDGLSDVTITSAAGGNLLENNGSGQFVNVAKSTINVGDFNDDATYQLRDAGLTSISGLTTAADKMIYTTASDTYAVTGLTSAGRALLDDADAAAQRTTLGLGTAATSASTDFQPIDAGLTSISGLTTSADKMIYTTASDTYAVADLTSAGRALLDDADAAAQRTTLGLGTAATSASSDFLASTAGINDLSDVTITSVTNGQVISYNSTSGEWENSTPASGGATDLDGLSDVTITSASSGQILRNNGSGQFVNVALSIVDDTSPQLGGALDVNGNAITSASNGNVTINPDGTGDISVGADIIPDADATHTLGSEDNRFITLHSELNGAVQFKARNETGGPLTKGQAVYISGVSGDVPLVSLARANSASTMPAHGLLAADVSNNADVQVISFGNLTAYNTTTHSLSLGDTVYVSAATAGALTSSAPAGETNLIQNIGKVVRASATEGIIKVGGAGRSAATPNLDNGKIFLGNASNQAVSTALSSINLTSFNDDLGSTYQPLDAGLTSISGLTTAADKMIYTTASDTYAVTDLTSAGRAILDDADATAQRATLGLVIGTDVLANVVEDTTPQLGGNLDTNGQDIVTTSNADLDLAPDGTGAVVLRGNTTGGNNQGKIKFNCENNSHAVTIQGPAHSAAATYTLTLPTSDGNPNQVLETDGSGVLSWVDQSGGGAAGWTYSAITADPANAQAGYHYSCTGTFTITLPTTGVSAGEEVRIKNMGTGTITVDPQTSNIDGSTTDYVMDIQYGAITLVSTGTHWEII